ncbi:hypothetical protein [Mesorhizobium sp. KR9-304]|uniref:hypothetical protein n=1 Tax=Mesorhizobium sp. KR9-304 TaxID=3156614 RepID=UPI0032B4C37E
MTTISNGSAPSIDEKHTIQPKVGVFTPTLTLAMALTILNLAVAVYIYRSTSSLIEIDGRLANLKAFEQRISNQLDMMNNGVQGRLEALQSDFQSQIGQLNDGITRLGTQGQPAAADEIVALPSLEPALEPAADPVADLEPEPLKEAPVASTTSSANVVPRQKSSAYERIQSADGKVYYRKVR